MAYQTPQFAFAGGPLDGQKVDKTNPGRWPLALDGDGVPIRSDRYYKELATTDTPDLYRLGHQAFDKGTEIRFYDWQGAK
jgi:hypothetical protein